MDNDSDTQKMGNVEMYQIVSKCKEMAIILGMKIILMIPGLILVMVGVLIMIHLNISRCHDALLCKFYPKNERSLQ